MIYWLSKLFTDPKGHASALYEVITTAIFSLSPIIITYFVQFAKSNGPNYPDVSDLVGRGQLFLLAYGVYGIIFWLAFLKDDKPRHGARALLGAIATFATLPIIGFIGVDPTFSSVLNEHLIRWSYGFYATLLILNYLLLFYLNIEPPQPAEVLDREAQRMRDEFRGMS